jgi:hypothetical protein
MKIMPIKAGIYTLVNNGFNLQPGKYLNLGSSNPASKETINPPMNAQKMTIKMARTLWSRGYLATD